MGTELTIVERFVIPHTAFAEAHQQIEACFRFAAGKTEAEGLAIVGESGTGKSTLLEAFQSAHKSKRGASGMEIPVVYAKVLPAPTVKSLAGVLLEALGAEDPERGTENEKSRRLRVLMRETGTKMVMLDEFQHFYDRGKRQIMHHAADWLKVLIDDTRTTLVVSGLPTCMMVIDANEQLARRFNAPIILPRFLWSELGYRNQFIMILKAFQKEIVKEYRIPDISSVDMAFRFYCATGGLIAYLSKLLRQALRNATVRSQSRIELKDLAEAHMQVVWSTQRISGLPKPFERNFKLVESVDLYEKVNRIGIPVELPPAPRQRRNSSARRQSVNASLVA